MREPQCSVAVRLELVKQLQLTLMKMFKCLEGEESARCLWMVRTARKDDDVSEEMPDYLISQCSNEHKTHEYLTLPFTPCFRAWHNSREVCACSVVSYVSQWPVNPLKLHNNNSHLACLEWKPTLYICKCRNFSVSSCQTASLLNCTGLW